PRTAPKPVASVTSGKKKPMIGNDPLAGPDFDQPPKAKRKAEGIDDLLSGMPSGRAHAADKEKAARDEEQRPNTRFAPPPPPREAPAAAKPGKAKDRSAPAAEAYDDEVVKTEAEGARGGGGPGGLVGGSKNKADGYGAGAAQPAPAPQVRNEAAKRPPRAPGPPAPAAG